jgi:hypothetical protein
MIGPMPETTLTKSKLRTPKAAAIAGIVFSTLLIATFLLLRRSLPPQPFSTINAAGEQAAAITLAIALIPFAGIAFLWLIGVVRDRLGAREDRLFATVFLGSGLLFLAMLFAAGAAISAIIVPAAQADRRVDPEVFAFARTFAFDLMNVYAIKMAAVFMFTTSTLAVYTEFVPRYLAYLGYLLALVVIFGSQYLDWSFLVFPAWILLLSVQILVDNYRGVPAAVK